MKHPVHVIPTCMIIDYGAEIYFYNIISVKLGIILLIPIYIFFNMNSLRPQMLNFIPREFPFDHGTLYNNLEIVY